MRVEGGPKKSDQRAPHNASHEIQPDEAWQRDSHSTIPSFQEEKHSSNQ